FGAGGIVSDILEKNVSTNLDNIMSWKIRHQGRIIRRMENYMRWSGMLRNAGKKRRFGLHVWESKIKRMLIQICRFVSLVMTEQSIVHSCLQRMKQIAVIPL